AQVHADAVQAVRDRRAGWTPRRVVGPEHEMVDEELRAASEEISEGRFSFAGLEAVLLVDSDPRQLLPPPRQLVATPRHFLLGLEQLQPGRKPLFTCSGLMVSHRFLSPHLVGVLSLVIFMLHPPWPSSSARLRRDMKMRSLMPSNKSRRLLL